MAKRNGLTSTHGTGSGFREDYFVDYDRWVFGHLVEAGPRTLNMVSSGMCPRGKEVPTPDALRHLPLKPPGRA
jgi:hypothetical protein